MNDTEPSSCVACGRGQAGDIHTCTMTDTEQRRPVRIEVGRRYIWESDNPRLMQHTVVTRIVVMENGDVRVYSTGRDGMRDTWNDADRFQKACVYAETEAT